MFHLLRCDAHCLPAWPPPGTSGGALPDDYAPPKGWLQVYKDTANASYLRLVGAYQPKLTPRPGGLN